MIHIYKTKYDVTNHNGRKIGIPCCNQDKEFPPFPIITRYVSSFYLFLYYSNVLYPFFSPFT